MMGIVDAIVAERRSRQLRAMKPGQFNPYEPYETPTTPSAWIPFCFLPSDDKVRKSVSILARQCRSGRLDSLFRAVCREFGSCPLLRHGVCEVC